MKDETSDLPLKGFVGLKSKMQTFITKNSESKKAKDISKKMLLMTNQNMKITKTY